MSLIVANRIQETCISPGTGPVALLGAAIQYVTFSSKLSNGDTTFYVIADAVGTNWEVGIGTYASSGNTLARTTVLSSSNAGSLVNFSSGTQNVWNDYPAEYAIYASNNASQASGQSLISSGVGTPPTWGNPVAPSGSPGYYGQFYDTTTQTAASTTVDYLIGCATTSISNGVSVSSGRITVANAGIYNFQFSLQLANTTSTIATTSVWVRYNGVDVANSASAVGVPIKRGSVNGLMLLALNQVFNMAAGDYIELWWQSDVAGVTIATIPSTSGPTVPQSPAVIYTMTQQAQIGIGYSGLTSTTSTLIGTGSKVFTTNLTSTQTAFAVGTRVRVAYSVTPANFMEGVVTAFSSTTFTVNVDSIGGSGTFASWTVSVAGIQGSNGVTSFSGNSTGLTPSTATTGAISLAGTLNVANGGTGATTLTGVLKGNGTSAFTAATSGTDYSAGTSALTTGILKSTTTTGALSIAVAADFPTLNQNTTGTAANLTAATTLPSGMTLVAPVLGTPASGNLSNCTFPTLNQNTTGTASNVTGTVVVANGGTGTATPALVAGSNVTITGTWPNQTIAASGGGGSVTKTISNKTAAYTVIAGDLGTIINCTSGTFTVSLTAAATLGTGFTCTIWNTGTGAITIDPNAAETIDGKSTLILRQGEGTDIVCNGTNWETSYKKTMRGYAENMQSTITRPVASGTNAIALGNNASSAGSNTIALGFTSSANGTFGIAIGYNTSAGIGDYSTSISSNSAGGGSVTATGAGAMALGGSYASGVDSFAAAVANNTSTYGATGANSVAIGYQAKASGIYSLCAATSNGGAVASGTYSVALSPLSVSSGYASTTIGGRSCIAAQIGKIAFGSAITFSVNGDFQAGMILLGASTTTSASVVLTSDQSAASTTNQLIVASGQAMAISGTLIAKQSASGNMAGWTITGIVSNNAGTMAVSGLALTPIGVDSIVLGVNLPTIAVDNTNKGVTITSGFKAATSIRWVANVQTSEITYA